MDRMSVFPLSWLNEIIELRAIAYPSENYVVFDLRNDHRITVGWAIFDQLDPFTRNVLLDYVFKMNWWNEIT